MKTFLIIIILYLLFPFTMISNIQDCKVTNSKIKSLVKQNWDDVKKKAPCLVSERKKVEIISFDVEGDNDDILSITVRSIGYAYDITFVVVFRAVEFDVNCILKGSVVDVYDCEKSS